MYEYYVDQPLRNLFPHPAPGLWQACPFISFTQANKLSNRALLKVHKRNILLSYTRSLISLIHNPKINYIFLAWRVEKGWPIPYSKLPHCRQNTTARAVCRNYFNGKFSIWLIWKVLSYKNRTNAFLGVFSTKCRYQPHRKPYKTSMPAWLCWGFTCWNTGVNGPVSQIRTRAARWTCSWFSRTLPNLHFPPFKSGHEAAGQHFSLLAPVSWVFCAVVSWDWSINPTYLLPLIHA